jgi:hypothetical protein
MIQDSSPSSPESGKFKLGRTIEEVGSETEQWLAD